MKPVRLALQDFLHHSRRRVAPNTLTDDERALRAFADSCAQHDVHHVGHFDRRFIRQHAEPLDGKLSPDAGTPACAPCVSSSTGPCVKSCPTAPRSRTT